MLTTEVLRDDIVAAGSADFTFTFPIYEEGHIMVLDNGTLMTINTDYTVRNGASLFSVLPAASLPAAGFIRFTVVPTVGHTISMIPLQPIQQASDYVVEPFPSGRIEKDLDKSIMVSRMFKEILRRTPKFDIKSLKQDVAYDDPIGDYFLKWNSSGTRLVGASGIASLGAVVVPITVVNGGFGANNSAVARGGIPVFTAAGVIGFITIGAKGAIFVSDGTDVQKLSVGANGFALIADSAQANGIKWAAIISLSGDNIFTGRSQGAKGASLTAAATLTLGADGNFFEVTGSTTITGISSCTAGTRVVLRFIGTPLLTHSSSLYLHGGANLQTIADDIIEFMSNGTGNWLQMTPVVNGAGGLGNRIVGANVHVLGQLRHDTAAAGRTVLPVGADKWAV